jgi:hypothetical protein
MPKLAFSDKVTFHLSNKTNKHNTQIQVMKNPNTSAELQQDSLHVRIFYTMLEKRIHGPLFFAKSTTAGIIYMDIMKK